MFSTNLQDILTQIDQIDPIKYARTRNFIDGDVTRLSPYISRGVISTKFVLDRVLQRGFDLKDIEKFVQELAWRDYWQQVWVAKGDAINSDLRQPQPDVKNHQIATAIISAKTGITAVDDAIHELYETGYMHNHLRMYVAALACNVGGSHWSMPAKWLYYHLLDGDWASNALSWQWVSGANSGKKYVANQENINKYTYTSQRGTIVDLDYSAFNTMKTPEILRETTNLELLTELPAPEPISLNPKLPTLVYNLYNMDPFWMADGDFNRVLLLEPSIFAKYPVSSNTVRFMRGLGGNIHNLQTFMGEFADLQGLVGTTEFHFKEHPLNTHYKGTMHGREWLTPVEGYFPSFFKFWNKALKRINSDNKREIMG